VVELSGGEVAAPGFEWGQEGCVKGGNGSFKQAIEKGSQVEVGTLPAGKRSIRVKLETAGKEDVDLRLYLKESPGTMLVGWPSGTLKKHNAESMVYSGSTITWSGYAGVTHAGDEYITIDKPLISDLVLYAYGYAAGVADVSYSFENSPCSASFTVNVPHQQTQVLGTIPEGLDNVRIELVATDDIDVQLQETAGQKKLIIGWPDGELNNAGDESRQVSLSSGRSQEATYSGYNGENGKKGNEWISMKRTNGAFEMRAYGYEKQKGPAKVTYYWYNRGSTSGPPPPGPPPATNLKIKSVDILKEPNRANKARHVFLYRDTATFSKLLVRRGSYLQFEVSTTMALTTNVALEGELNLIHNYHAAYVQKLPMLSQSKKCGIDGLDNWHICISGVQTTGGSFIYSVMLHVPVSAPFAQWKLDLHIVKGGAKVSSYTGINTNIFTLFNPYHSQDSVYIHDPASQREYIENENGAIWVGSSGRNSPRSWAYNQFNIQSVIAAYKLLCEKTEHGYQSMPVQYLSDPVRVARALSYKVGRYMLLGRWQEPYDPHTKPWMWPGSLPIISQYLSTNQAVRWGQCWVFSGLLTTLGRSIGIPTRSVTNFESAHDRKPFDNFMTKHWTYTVAGTWQHNSEYDKDSVWNFHVWNDMWMKRPDEKNNNCNVNMDGWQAVDATWQERSNYPNIIAKSFSSNKIDPNKYYQCGPLSLNAIKAKCKSANYDYLFIHGEVESDSEEIIRNLQAGSNTFKRGGFGYTKNTAAVGKYLSTSALGGNPLVRNIITTQYKQSEDPMELGDSSSRKKQITPYKKGWGTIQVQHTPTMHAGADYNTKIDIQKKTSGPNMLKVSWALNLQRYNGVFVRKIKEMTQTVNLDTRSAEVEIKLKSSEYVHLLKQGMTISLDASGVQGKELIFRFSEVKSVVSLPAIEVNSTVTTVEKCVVAPKDQHISFSMKIKNPFKSLPINASTLTAEISGLDKTPEYNNPEWTIPVDKMPEAGILTISKNTVDVSSLACGIHTISVTWDINEVVDSTDASGAATFKIDCSKCSVAVNQHDESNDKRVKTDNRNPQAHIKHKPTARDREMARQIKAGRAKEARASRTALKKQALKVKAELAKLRNKFEAHSAHADSITQIN
jgi:hypothetical protein